MQSELFDDLIEPSSLPTSSNYIRHDFANASLHEYPHFIPIDDANSLVSTFISDIDWQQAEIKIAGKILPVPRLQCWMGEKQSRYGYSGLSLNPVDWHPLVLKLKMRIETLCKAQFNSVLLNYYRDGNDSVAWHADDEKELGIKPRIASLSLGANRDFELRPKHDKLQAKRKMVLRSGSLLMMNEGLQENWLHQLPKDKAIDKPRINLTFRKIIF